MRVHQLHCRALEWGSKLAMVRQGQRCKGSAMCRAEGPHLQAYLVTYVDASGLPGRGSTAPLGQY